MNKYDFICPECGDRNLEQQMTNVTVNTAITVDNEGRIQWGLSTNSGDVEIIEFVCGAGHILEMPNGPVIDEDDLIAWFDYRTYFAEQVARQLGDIISHDHLVQRISDAHDMLEGQELADLWNDIFPKHQVTHEGDDIYRWVKT